MIFIFEKKTIFICLFAYILNFINCKVIITSPFKSFFLNKLNKLGLKLNCSSIIYADMSEHNLKDIGVINGDLNDIAKKCVDDLYQDVDTTIDLSFFFVNIQNLQKKIKLFFYEYFDSLYYSQIHVIAWLESSVYKNSIIFNVSSLRLGAKLIWKHSNLRVFFILNYLTFFIGTLDKATIFFFKYLVKITFIKFKNIKKNNIKINLLQENSSMNQNEVLFFPHNGAITFGNPPRDYFYSNQIDSPFHPSKITHLEYDYRLNVKLQKERMKDYFNTNLIHYTFFTNTHFPLKNVISFIIKIFSTIRNFNFKNIGNNLLYFYILLTSFLIFIRCCKSLEIYKKAKIALIGYDILFPKALSLSLESLNIKTIAASERFIIPYINKHSFNFDTVFSISDSQSKKIIDSNRLLANNIFPVGQIRTDHFFDAHNLRSNFKERVLILDFNIEADFELEKFKVDTNWKNDINFRNEILSLAEDNLEIEFIFRGKNCDWYKNKYHKAVIKKVDSLPNVSVDTDYSYNYWQSYHLCASANLIIARPTSLAEECVSKGMDVIVVDYGINYTTTVSKFLPKILRQYHCHSYEELNEMFSHWLKNKSILPKEKKNQIKKMIFSNLTDGKVKLRIQKHLKEIYEQIK